jgi:hypothetical protein
MRGRRKWPWVLGPIDLVIVLVGDDYLSAPDPKEEIRSFRDDATKCLDSETTRDAAHGRCRAVLMGYDVPKYDATHLNCPRPVVLFRREVLREPYKCERTGVWVDPPIATEMLRDIEARAR